jgi:vacuolar-type H+-ATPase subunit I/STV1
MRINRAASEVDDFYSMFTPPEDGEFEFFDLESADQLGRELNLYNAEQPPLTDSMGRLLSDERFLINTDTEEGLAEMTDADIQAEIQRMVEEAETGTTMRPQDGQETDPIQARRNKDAEEAAQKEYEERQKAREAEGDTFEGAPEFEEGEEMGEIEEYNKYLDATRDAEAYEKYKAATEKYEETADYEKYKAATEQYEDIAPYSYEPGQTPKQDVSDLADELGQEIGTPLPDDVPTSPNIMTEEEFRTLRAEMESTTPGLKGGGESGMTGEISVVEQEAVEEAERIIAGAEAAGTIILKQND